ncbi:MAG TPA: TonB-dependent receptor [Rugosibacter sp.]|nr:TonB-dependent receptor [Rugosibacter sp.]HQQ34804.1 TonB-dependent receptor [Rugosibacter sp.]
MNKKNHFFSPKKLSLAIASALVSMAAIANDNNPEPILVQATKPAANTPFSTAVTSADITSQRAATSDTASLLRDIPGISLYGAGGVSSLPAIHGLADDRLRIKVDGMDLLSSCPNHMNSPLSYLDPSQVETLKVYAGITPVSVGGDSIGGTIIADTAAPEFAAPGQGHLLKGQVGAFYRSNNNARGGNLTATYATEMLNITYSGATTQADNYTAGGDFKTTSATGRPGHTLPLDEVGSTAYKANNHALNLALKHDNHLFEVKYSFQDIPYEGFPNQRMDMLDNTAHRINLHYLGEFGWGSLDARAYRETVTHFMNFGDDKQFWYGDAPGMPMHTESKNTGGVVKANIKLTAQDLLRVGGEYQRYQLDDWWPASGTGMMMAPNTFWNINDGQRDRTALFGEWESRINPAWTTLLGARYEQVKTDAGPVQGYSMMYAADANTFNARNRERTDNNWDATALARYTADATRTVEFGYAMKTRSPNLYERYSWSRIGMALEMNNFLGDGNGYLGDPDLKPEKAHTLSATFDWHAPDRAWEFKATPYYSHVTDYIDARRCGSGTGMMAPCGGVANNTGGNKFVHLQYANQSARLYGIDLSGHMPLGKTGAGDLGLKGLLNYTNGENRDTGDDLYNIMPLNAKLTLTQKRGGWDNSVELVMVKAKNNISDVRNEIKTPGYSLVNLRGSYTWKQARVDFGVENLFDKRYYLPTGGAYTGQGTTMSFNAIPWGIVVPGMGRSLYTGLSYAF